MPAIISSLRRACQISGVAAAPEFQKIRKTHPRDAVGRVRPEPRRAEHVASFGATMRLVAVTPE